MVLRAMYLHQLLLAKLLVMDEILCNAAALRLPATESYAAYRLGLLLLEC